jgi:hypothetical protein
VTLRRTLQPTSAVVDYLSTFLIRPCRVANIPCAHSASSVHSTQVCNKSATNGFLFLTFQLLGVFADVAQGPMAYYHHGRGYRNNHWQKFNNRERTLTQDSSASSLTSTSSSHYHHQPSRQHSQNWSEANGTPLPQTSPKMGQDFRQTPAPNLPPGQNDLEILENLKGSIISNQHEFFRSVPQPAALAKIYMGNASISPVPPHPEQMSTAQNTPRKDASIGDDQRRGRASSIDSRESRKQVQPPQTCCFQELTPDFLPAEWLSSRSVRALRAWSEWPS